MSPVIAYLILGVVLLIWESIRGREIKGLSILSLGLGITMTSTIIEQIVLVSAILVIMIAEKDRETIILFNTGIIGLMVVGGATELIKLYIGIEIVSLSFYILAGRERKGMKSTEAGIKYFVLGALSSGILLMGITIVYAQTGSTDIELIETVSRTLIIIGILFKLGAAPFHVWVPDVYEGSATIVTTYFAIVPKIAYIGILMKIGGGEIVILAGALSILVGSLGAINQTKIKRLLAYSAIGHVGFMIIGVGIGTYTSIQAAIIYMIIYVIMTVNTFTIVKSLGVKKIAELRGLSRRNGVIAMTLGLGMMSIAGVPPLAGFLNKYLVVLSAVTEGYMEVAIIAVILSVISSFYYIRIIRYMYFKDQAEVTVTVPQVKQGSAIVLGITTYMILTIMIYPQWLLQITEIY